MVTDNLVGLSMLLTLISHFYFMQLQKIDSWFISLGSRECFCVGPTTLLFVNKFKKNLRTAGKKLVTAKYVFS